MMDLHQLAHRHGRLVPVNLPIIDAKNNAHDFYPKVPRFIYSSTSSYSLYCRTLAPTAIPGRGASL